MIYPRTEREARLLEDAVAARIHRERNKYSSSDFIKAIEAINGISFRKDGDNVVFKFSDWPTVLWNKRIQEIFDTQRPHIHSDAIITDVPMDAGLYHGLFSGNDGVMIRIWTSEIGGVLYTDGTSQ